MKNTTYADAGINLELGDDASKILYEAAKLTWKNRKGKLGEVVELFEDFSGLRGINVGGLPSDTFMNISFDGVGTKMELGERLAKHDTVAYDLFAMVCDDAVVRGAEPVIVGSILDVKTLGDTEQSYINFVKQLAIGYISAARDANVAIVNGEVAELGARVQGYGPFNYNWGAGVVWFSRKSRLLSGYEIKDGDSLVGLKEDGFRSNGLSLVRKIMRTTHGEEWHHESLGDKRLGDLTLHPSRIYTKTVVEMFGGFDGEPKAELHGVVHITGGGVPGKLRRVLKPTGLGAYLHDPFVPCDLMHYCQEKGGIKDEEAYRTWNMGQGMILITPDPEAAITVAREHTLEAKVIGQVTRDQAIRISNRGLYRHTQRELVY